MSVKATQAEMQFLRDVVKKHSGIFLTPEKDYLLETRLLPLLRKLNLATLSDLTARLKAGMEQGVVDEIIDAMTTNETSFFRDLKPFSVMRDTLLPAIIAQKKPGEPVRILSAACSSGQEAYSIALTVLENKAKWNGVPFQIHGVDLDRTILAKAREAVYTQFEVQRGLPITLLLKYFTQEEERWRLKPEVRQMVEFAHGNLTERVSGGPFDIILCRNVLIYFEEALKKQVIANLLVQLAPERYFIIGASESGFGLSPHIEAVADAPGVYRHTRKT